VTPRSRAVLSAHPGWDTDSHDTENSRAGSPKAVTEGVLPRQGYEATTLGEQSYSTLSNTQGRPRKPTALRQAGRLPPAPAAPFPLRASTFRAQPMSPARSTLPASAGPFFITTETTDMARSRKTSEAHYCLSEEQKQQKIQAAFPAIYGLMQQVEAKKAEHIKPLTDTITKAWRQLKTDTNIDQADIKPFFLIFIREQIADAAENEADAERIRENLKRAFEALQTGDTLDLLAAFGQVETLKGKAATDEEDEDDDTRPEPVMDESDEEPRESGPAPLDATANGGQGGEKQDDEPEVLADAGAALTTTADDSEFAAAGHVFQAGRTAALEGAALESNPHDGVQARLWANGWTKGNAEREAHAGGAEVVSLGRKPRTRKAAEPAPGVTVIDGVEYHDTAASSELGANRPAFPIH